MVVIPYIFFTFPNVKFEFRVSRAVGEMNNSIFVDIPINPCEGGSGQKKKAKKYH
jgi:hypothetical protein